MQNYPNVTKAMIILACIGLMASAVGMNIAAMSGWGGFKTPLFVGSFISHVGAVITAFVSGRLFSITQV